MKFTELAAVLPCHSFDDFPFYLRGNEAEGVLAAYTALWHPALITSAGKTPSWRRSDDPAEQLAEGALVTLPAVCRDDMPGSWIDDARGQGACVVEGGEGIDRAQMVATALAMLLDPPGEPDATLLSDFFALGLCHLLTEVLTVQMRYSSLLDESRFEDLLVEAADAAFAGNDEVAREKLHACFDCLSESRDHFYPVDAFLIDLILVAPSTMGPGLAEEFERDVPTNVLISGDDLAILHQRFPDVLAALRRGVEEGRICVVGGEPSEDLQLPFQTLDVLISHLQRGKAIYEQHLGRSPTIFGRRRFGLSPVLPQLLTKGGFTGALHFTLDEGQFPRADQSKVHWEGVDGSSIDSVTRIPLDAQRPESVLAVPQHLSDAMDTDHVAALCFAHWPQQVTTWYRELQRIGQFASVLGKFATLEHFFEETNLPGEGMRSGPDEYRSPYLRQMVTEGSERPISGTIQQITLAQQQQCVTTIDAMAGMIDGRATDGAPVNDAEPPPETDATLPGLDSAMQRLAAALPRHDAAPVSGYLAVNPFSFPYEVAVDTPALSHSPEVSGAVKAAYELGGRRQVVVELPPLGYVWIAGQPGRKWVGPASKPLAEPHLLRNEHFEVSIHPATGGIESIHCPRHRGNLLSQQLAMRMPPVDGEPGSGHGRRRKPQYSTMLSESIDVTETGPATAAITSRGRLQGRDDVRLANFRQTTRLMRTAPVLDIDIELDPVVLPEGDPWHSYYAARFAWKDSAAEVRRGIALGSHESQRQRLEAPQFVELLSGSAEIAILTCGLPYHLRIGERQMDSLLIVPGETGRRFHLRVGIDAGRPQLAALQGLAPEMVLAETTAPPSPNAAWLIHLDTGQAMVTHCQVVQRDQRVVGVRVRLLETAGRSVKARLRAFRSLSSARKLDFRGEQTAGLQPSEDRVTIELVGHECCEAELIWQDDSDD